MMLIIEAAAAAALGAAIISLIIILRFFMAIPVGSVSGGDMYTVIAVHGTAPELENTVLSLKWLIKTGRLSCGIIIIDCGLEKEARRTAELLARGDMYITLCSQEQAALCLQRGNLDGG